LRARLSFIQRQSTQQIAAKAALCIRYYSFNVGTQILEYTKLEDTAFHLAFATVADIEFVLV